MGPKLEHMGTIDRLLLLDRDNMPPPPANTTLRQLEMPSHHEGTQDDPNELDFWLGRNRFSYPQLAKWLALHLSKK